jgi:ATP-dependent exoDNAse (exonuclease V) beta subunit
MDIRERLKVFDDPLFRFDPKWHKYTYDSTPLQSVTKFIGSFHEPFDEQAVSKKVSESTGVPQDQILAEWKQKNTRAIEVGHATHEWIENYFNGVHQVIPTDLDIVDRINKFNLAYAKYLHKLEPVCFEKRIFHSGWGMAGTIDSLFTYKDKVIMVDYKTNGEFRDDSHPKGCYNKLRDPFGDLCQNHLNDYSIQVSMYSLMLEEVAGIKVDKCYMLHIGPEETKMWTALDLRDRLRTKLNTTPQVSQ